MACRTMGLLGTALIFALSGCAHGTIAEDSMSVTSAEVTPGAASPPPEPMEGPPMGGPGDGMDPERLALLGEQLLLEKVPPPQVDLPAPSADPRDIEGTYIGNQFTDLRIRSDLEGNPVPYTDRAQRILDRRLKATYVDRIPYANAGAKCLPPGAPWQFGLLYPFSIFQTEHAITFIFSEYHTIWNIRLDERRTEGDERAYMGQSYGRWENDTLVVETSHFALPLWVDADGSPASKDAKLTLRIRKVTTQGDPGLEIVTTIEDPAMYTRPWSYARTYVWRPDMEYFSEYDCESQLAGPDALSQYGLQPEPEEE